MRSRTSRGVPEWSEGKELYIGSEVLPPEVFRASPVVYRDHRRGPGIHREGPRGPGGIHGPSVRRDQPLGGLGRLPTKAHAPGEKRGQTLGQMGPKGPCLVRLPLPPLGRHPRWVLGLPRPLGWKP